ncbi:MAG: AraC family transcriptional regulator [Phycisphaerae bacterium]
MIAQTGPYSVQILSADDAPRFYAWQKPARQLPWYLMVCSLAGREQITVHGQAYDILPGQSYLVPPGAISVVGSQRGNRPIWIHFEVRHDLWRQQRIADAEQGLPWPQQAPRAQPCPPEVWGVDLPIVIPAMLQGHFASAEGLPRVVRLWKQHTPLAVMESQHLLAGLLLMLVTEAWRKQTPAPPDPLTRIARAEALARENLGSGFGVGHFAAAAGYSRSRFSLLYQQHRGGTPGDFLRQLRLTQACQLLATTTQAVHEIARLVGYPDPTVFGRVFRRHQGCTPKQWRQTRGGSHLSLKSAKV